MIIRSREFLRWRAKSLCASLVSMNFVRALRPSSTHSNNVALFYAILCYAMRKSIKHIARLCTFYDTSLDVE